MNPDEFSAIFNTIIEVAIDAFLSRASATQNRTFDNIRAEVEKLDRDSKGNIKSTVSNLRIKERIKRNLKGIIVDEKHISNVDKFIEAFSAVEKQMKKYFGQFDDFDEQDSFLETIILDSVDATKNSLLESGMEENIINEVEKILNQNITTGARFRDMVGQIRTFIKGSDERVGRLERYSGQIVNDSIHQYARNYMQTAAKGLGMEWFLYSGGSVKDTRDFCLERMSFHFHETEIKKWPSLQWKGKIPTTTPSNIFTLLGGYNCRHELIPAVLSQILTTLIDGEKKSKIVVSGLSNKSSEKDDLAGIRSGAKDSLSKRLSGDELLNAIDLMDELVGVGAVINPDGSVIVYHRTREKNANEIISSMQMFGLEDGIFFSTKKDGQAVGYGESVIQMSVPIELLELDDIFSDEAHVAIRTNRAGEKISISGYSPKITDGSDPVESDPQHGILASGIPVKIIYVADPINKPTAPKKNLWFNNPKVINVGVKWKQGKHDGIIVQKQNGHIHEITVLGMEPDAPPKNGKPESSDDKINKAIGGFPDDFNLAKNYQEVEERILNQYHKKRPVHIFGNPDIAALKKMHLSHLNSILFAVENSPVLPDKITTMSDMAKKYPARMKGWTKRGVYGVKIGSDVGINTRQFKTIADIEQAKIKVNVLWNDKTGNNYFLKPNGNSTMIHEFGHLFDSVRGVSWKHNEWETTIHKKWYRETNIGHIKTSSEAWADAFADYYLNAGENIPDYVDEWVHLRVTNAPEESYKDFFARIRLINQGEKAKFSR